MQYRLSSLLYAWRWRRAQKTAGPLMAKATYEPLESEERARLNRLCREFPQLDKEQEQFERFAKQFHVAGEQLPIDLSGRINVALSEPLEYRRQRLVGVYAATLAIALLVAGIYAGVMLIEGSNTDGRQETAQQGSAPATVAPAPQEPITPAMAAMNGRLARAMEEACRMVDDSDRIGAATLLEETIADASDASLAGEALLLLADIEYTYLQRYDQALEAFETLRGSHPDIFDSRDESMTRYELLLEAKHEEFAPLHHLDAARDHGSFQELERLVVQYPGTLLAQVAIEEMGRLVKGPEQGGMLNLAEALEEVRAQCSEPVAAAQVNLLLGDHYRGALNDRARAHAAYSRAAASDHIALSHRAHQALSRLE